MKTQIEVESAVTRRSAFRVRLPLAVLGLRNFA
jgi:hypothetical protein